LAAIDRLALVPFRRRFLWSVAAVTAALGVGAIWPEFANSGCGNACPPPGIGAVLPVFALFAGLSLGALLAGALVTVMIATALDAWHIVRRAERTWHRVRHVVATHRQKAWSTLRGMLGICLAIAVSVASSNFLLFFALAFSWLALVGQGIVRKTSHP
jgi:hypothetical protein